MSDRAQVIVSLHIFLVLGIGIMTIYSSQKKGNWNGFDKRIIKGGHTLTVPNGKLKNSELEYEKIFIGMKVSY